MATITLSDDSTIDAPANQRLVLAIEDSGVDILHECGGNARCTTCRVHFLAGEPDRMTKAERDRLDARGLLGQMRLSCQILCDHDMKVEVINHLSTSDLEDAGPRPADDITPIAVWIDKPES